ncbi:hypothetical protein [Dokdonia sp. PRO95]|uniref:hypothetical protein n=1 Tax=Dokdonia sp. PRO95 TaxID=1239415 RepID=UPI00054F8DBF|nr:hypothetical protein [Dokdonia sp. PRO95]
MKRRYLLLVVLLPVLFIISTGFIVKDDNGNAIAAMWFKNQADTFVTPTLESFVPDFPGGFNSPVLGTSYIGFKEALAFSESSGNYFAVNRLGYKGRYQFGQSTLKWVGVDSARDFMNSPAMQESAFDALVARNKYVLREYITAFDGKTIGGHKVTESGLIAAAHLCGAGNVKKFLDSGGEDVFADANNVPLTSYLSRFGNFDTSIIPANASAKATL